MPDWVQRLFGDERWTAVKQHIQQVMGKTRGLLEQWDVDDGNLHGFEDTLQKLDDDIQLFREAHQADPDVKLFTNVIDVTTTGAFTYDYVARAKRIKQASVGLYGMAVRFDFYDPQEADPSAIMARLNILAEAGMPIWVAALAFESRYGAGAADLYEAALRAVYAHPAVEGVVMQQFTEQLDDTGRRVLDLLENQWMTDVTKTLTQSGNAFTVRGFHGDYEVHVIYRGKDLGNLRQTFTLGKDPRIVNINVYT